MADLNVSVGLLCDIIQLLEASSSQYRSSSLPQSQSDDIVVNSNPNYRPLDSPPCVAAAAGVDGDDNSAQSNRQSSKYASRPLPATPMSSDLGPDSQEQFPCNMSLARALDHDRDRQSEPQAVSGGVSSRTVADQGVERSRQTERASRSDAKRGFNVAQREPSCDDWPTADGVKNGKRSEVRHESAGRSRRRSTSRKRSSQKTDESNQAPEVAGNFDV
jgi:hypothetical protein